MEDKVPNPCFGAATFCPIFQLRGYIRGEWSARRVIVHHGRDGNRTRYKQSKGRKAEVAIEGISALIGAPEKLPVRNPEFLRASEVIVPPRLLAVSHIPDTSSATVTLPTHACCVHFLSRGRSVHLRAGLRFGLFVA